MNIIKIIERKKNKKELTTDEIKYVVEGYLNGEIKDYQMSSLLMAITINGMSKRETFDLTKLMLESGDKIDLSNINGVVIDKHSTGGVGDKTTLILSALVASCGVKVAKMSGRGLGHTGGTIDKLESIDVKTEMSFEEFINQVNDIGVAIVGQMGNLVPADKKIYALRDVTGTVDSIPLIASSIMSKKLASGADKIVIDLKVGNGALVKDIDQANELANLMIEIGKENNKEVVCILSDMEQPLGNSIGNSLEVIESINVLKNNGPEDVRQLVIELASYMVSMGENITKEEAKEKVLENLENGKALEKFKQLVKRQGGNIDDIKVAPKVFSIKSIKEGNIVKIDTLKLGEIVKMIGGGRNKKDEKINFGVGIVLNKKIGDHVCKDEEILKIYLDEKDMSIKEILSCFEIGDSIIETSLIKGIIK